MPAMTMPQYDFTLKHRAVLFVITGESGSISFESVMTIITDIGTAVSEVVGTVYYD
jgi:hypothetical protein